MPKKEVFLNKTVLVTGGTGSFGQRFVSELIKLNTPKKIIVFSRDEFKQHEMKSSISDLHKKLRFFLGDVRDATRLQRAFSGVQIVVHAAALKQVPAIEYNPLEAIKTNIQGTQNVIDAALDNKVEKVLLISTDKAVNPVNLYGATKLCAEKLFVAANAYRKDKKSTIFSVVRYGNVMGSRGSIVEVLAKQKETGTVMLTDERMTRFWITLDGGVRLVIDAITEMKGGEIFVPKLKSLKIKDLIEHIAPNCKIKVIGIRPGEKIHEALLGDDEYRHVRETDKYYVVEPEHDWWDNTHLKSSKKVSENFIYSSNKGDYLSKGELIKMLKG